MVRLGPSVTSEPSPPKYVFEASTPGALMREVFLRRRRADGYTGGELRPDFFFSFEDDGSDALEAAAQSISNVPARYPGSATTS